MVLYALAQISFDYRKMFMNTKLKTEGSNDLKMVSYHLAQTSFDHWNFLMKMIFKDRIVKNILKWYLIFGRKTTHKMSTKMKYKEESVSNTFYNIDCRLNMTTNRHF